MSATSASVLPEVARSMRRPPYPIAGTPILAPAGYGTVQTRT
ncbi:hypothetical protein AB0F15_21420 [Amycolatopsis sp. NPDC026612]